MLAPLPDDAPFDTTNRNQFRYWVANLAIIPLDVLGAYYLAILVMSGFFQVKVPLSDVSQPLDLAHWARPTPTRRAMTGPHYGF